LVDIEWGWITVLDGMSDESGANFGEDVEDAASCLSIKLPANETFEAVDRVSLNSLALQPETTRYTAWFSFVFENALIFELLGHSEHIEVPFDDHVLASLNPVICAHPLKVQVVLLLLEVFQGSLLLSQDAFVGLD